MERNKSQERFKNKLCQIAKEASAYDCSRTIHNLGCLPYVCKINGNYVKKYYIVRINAMDTTKIPKTLKSSNLELPLIKTIVDGCRNAIGELKEKIENCQDNETIHNMALNYKKYIVSYFNSSEHPELNAYAQVVENAVSFSNVSSNYPQREEAIK